VPLPVRTLHRRLLSAPWAARVSHSGWTCSAHPCHFNGRLRDELLSSEIFDTLAEARYLIDRWRLFYNHRRIERARGRMTPAAFAAAFAAAPPLRFASLACAAAPPRTQGATTMHQLS
jgi:hypothetical protein